jgi:hypothetical protein
MSENGWSSDEVPFVESMKGGSTKATSGSVPAAQSATKASKPRVMGTYFGPHSARKGASLA